ncbi:MAG: photosynthetic complex putative assembly protein PuhB [Pseudomonadota bacterium]
MAAQTTQDFAFDPAPGLSHNLPKGEEILWQGRPSWRALAVESFALKWVAGYFVLLAIWRGVSLLDVVPLAQALFATLPILVLGLLAIGIFTLISWMQARAAIYTVTTGRIVMKIGVAMPVTYNLPYGQIANANLDLRSSGLGTIAFETLGKMRFSYLLCWPHVRPWKTKKPQLALRLIPEAEKVAGLIAEAAETRVSTPQVQRAPAGAAVAAE